MTIPADDINNFAYIRLVAVPVAAIKTEESSVKTFNSSDWEVPELWGAVKVHWTTPVADDILEIKKLAP